MRGSSIEQAKILLGTGFAPKHMNFADFKLVMGAVVGIAFICIVALIFFGVIKLELEGVKQLEGNTTITERFLGNGSRPFAPASAIERQRVPVAGSERTEFD